MYGTAAVAGRAVCRAGHRKPGPGLCSCVRPWMTELIRTKGINRTITWANRLQSMWLPLQDWLVSGANSIRAGPKRCPHACAFCAMMGGLP